MASTINPQFWLDIGHTGTDVGAVNLVRTIFDQPDAAEVPAQFGRVVTALEAKLPAAAGHLSAAETDLLAFTAVPREIWRQIWSSNPQERLNKELRRRTDVVGIFPDRAAVIRLVGAVLMEQAMNGPKPAATWARHPRQSQRHSYRRKREGDARYRADQRLTSTTDHHGAVSYTKITDATITVR